MHPFAPDSQKPALGPLAGLDFLCPFPVTLLLLNRSIAILVVALPASAHAGMPSFTVNDLTEAAAARLDVISFFILIFLLCTWLTKWAWNVLAASFPIMPRLRFKQALALMLVSSLFLYVVLTMISGARELMTPGAWVKSGSTYQLAPPERDPKPWLESARQRALERLRDALWSYAMAHDGKLPPHREGSHIERQLWAGAHPQGEPYAFFPDAKPGDGHGIVAYEPGSYGAMRFLLTADGVVSKLSAADLRRRLDEMLKQGRNEK
jgi:hypothetical protein